MIFKRILSVLSLGIVALVSACAHVGHSRQTVEASYFRMKVALSHKGEPIDVNLVIPCQTVITPHHSDGPSVETLGGTVAYVVAVKGGHAVGVRTVGPNYMSSGLCTGDTTANGRVPRDWLPIVLWFDRAEDLSFAVAYVTQDAYENPSSQLEFHGATVEKATKADFEEFQANGPPNLLPPYLSSDLRGGIPGLRGHETEILAPLVSEPWRAWRYGEMLCNGVERRPLTPRQRDLIRPLWPAGHPHFWTMVTDWKTRSDLLDRLYPRPPNRYPVPAKTAMWGFSYKWGLQTYDFTADGMGHGVTVKDAMTHDELEKYRPQMFPVKIDVGLSTLSRDVYKDGGIHIDIHIGDGRKERGFLYCEAQSEDLNDLITGRKTHPWDFGGEQSLCRIDGIPMPQWANTCWNSWKIAFEDDEYIIFGIPEFRF